MVHVQNIRGTVSVERNLDLLPDRQTREEFVYRIDRVCPINAIFPLLSYREPLDMVACVPQTNTGPQPVVDRLAAFFGSLLDLDSSSPAPQSRPLLVAASYVFPLAEATRETARGGATQPPIVTRVPVLLRPISDFVPERDLTTDEGLCPALARALTGWADANSAWERGGRFGFDIAVYSSIPAAVMSGSLKPSLELKDVRLPLEAVERS